MASPDELRSYIIKGGEEGRARLSVLASVLEPTTGTVLDRFEPLKGRLAIDAGCGGGDVSFEIAERVGPGGKVVAFDLDETKLAAAREGASARGLAHLDFVKGSVAEPWPAREASFVYVRFVLTHLPRPEALLARALPRPEWTHEAHLAATTYLLMRRPDVDIDAELPGIIRRYNESVGGVNSDSEGYHETITRIFLHGVRIFLKEADPDAPLHEIVNELLLSSIGRRDWPLKFYSAERLFSIEARRKFVAPDLAPLS